MDLDNLPPYVPPMHTQSLTQTTRVLAKGPTMAGDFSCAISFTVCILDKSKGPNDWVIYCLPSKFSFVWTSIGEMTLVDFQRFIAQKCNDTYSGVSDVRGVCDMFVKARDLIV
jgi:hypothetical protein